MVLPKKNPFAPGYGKRPPVLVGRDHILEDFEDALDSPQHPSTALLVSGPRGIGKTVILDRLGVIAQEHGWHIIRTSAVQSDWLEALAESVIRQHVEYVGTESAKKSISSISAFGIGVTFDENAQSESKIRLRDALRTHAKALAEHDTGLVLLIDEIQTANIESLRALGDDHQIIAESEQLPVMIAVASLPSLEAELEEDNVKATFLQRMDRRTLGRLDDEEVLRAIIEPFADHVRFDEAASRRIVAETKGAPYFAQLLGFQLWKLLSKDFPEDDITEALVDAAARKAFAVYGRTVADTLMKDLTPVERTFLFMMAADDTDGSDIADIAARMGQTLNYAYNYRHRLLTADVIFASGTRQVSFVDPGIKEFVRQTPQFQEMMRKLNDPAEAEE